MEKLESKAMGEGYADFVDGIPRSGCPYHKGTALSDYWLKGWDRADRDEKVAHGGDR